MQNGAVPIGYKRSLMENFFYMMFAIRQGNVTPDTKKELIESLEGVAVVTDNFVVRRRVAELKDNLKEAA